MLQGDSPGRYFSGKMRCAIDSSAAAAARGWSYGRPRGSGKIYDFYLFTATPSVRASRVFFQLRAADRANLSSALYDGLYAGTSFSCLFYDGYYRQ